MKNLRKIYEVFEADKETLLTEKLTNGAETQTEKYFGQPEFVKIFNEFKKQYKAFQQDVLPSVFNAAIKAAGSVGKVLSQSEMIDMPEAKGKVFFNACHIYIRNKTLLITICGNTYTYRLEVSVKFENNAPLRKDYDITKFSADILEEQIIECLKRLSVK